MIVYALFDVFMKTTVVEWIYAVIQSPMQGVTDSLGDALMIGFLTPFLWLFRSSWFNNCWWNHGTNFTSKLIGELRNFKFWKRINFSKWRTYCDTTILRPIYQCDRCGNDDWFSDVYGGICTFCSIPTIRAHQPFSELMNRLFLLHPL